MTSFTYQFKNPNAVYYVSGLPGTGKTSAFRELCPELLTWKNVLYVGPSKALGRQEYQNQVKAGLAARLINLDTTGSVLRELTYLLTDREGALSDAGPDFRGMLVNITDQAWNLLRVKPNANWDVWKDELPSLEQEYRFKLDPKNYWHLSDFVKLDIYQPFEGLCRLKVIDRAKAKAFIDDHCDMRKLVKQLMVDLVHRKRDVYAHPETWDKLTSNKPCKDKERLRFIGFLRPDWYQGTTVMGALFEQSPLYHWWRKHFPHVQILKRTDIERRLEPFNIGGRLRIRYVLDEIKNSKYQRDRAIRNVLTGKQRTIFHAMLDKVKEGLTNIGTTDQKPIMFVNNAYRGLVEASGLDVDLLSIMSQGLNAYENRTAAIIAFSQNKDYVDREMYQRAGVLEELDTWNKINPAFQNIMRTNLRNRNSSATVNVIVDDKVTATAIAAIANCKDVQEIPGRLLTNEEVWLEKPKKPNTRKLQRKIREDKIIKVLSEADRSMTKQEIAKQMGMKPRNGYLSRLLVDLTSSGQIQGPQGDPHTYRASVGN